MSLAKNTEQITDNRMINIDRGLTPPPLRPRTGPRQRYPWDRMAVGDSFVVHNVSRNAMRTTASYHEKTKGWVFEIEPDGDGYRVWRMA